MLYCMQFPEGPERVHALIAFQMTLGVFAILLGSTGLASKVVSSIPSAIRAGIILGAGFAAVVSIFEVGGRFETFPWTISIAVGIGFYLLFSKHFSKLKTTHPIWGLVGKLGIFRSSS